MDKRSKFQHFHRLPSQRFERNSTWEWNHYFKPNLNPPTFNYVTFLKTLSTCQILDGVERFLKNPRLNTRNGLSDDQTMLMTQEIFKMLINNPSLKTLGIEPRIF